MASLSSGDTRSERWPAHPQQTQLTCRPLEDPLRKNAHLLKCSLQRTFLSFIKIGIGFFARITAGHDRVLDILSCSPIQIEPIANATACPTFRLEPSQATGPGRVTFFGSKEALGLGCSLSLASDAMTQSDATSSLLVQQAHLQLSKAQAKW